MAKKIYDEKINKSTDWGGDESTGGLPVAGSRVQEFIKEQLNGKAGIFYYDTANNRYIVFADAESRDAYLADTTKTDLIIGTFDAPFNYSAEITLSTPTYVAILAETKNNYIDFTFDTKNKNGQSVGEAVIVTYTFIKAGIKKVVTEKYQYGASVHFKIDDYISTGTNTITVGVVGQNTLAATTVGLTYQVVDLQLTDTYDISQSYNLITNPAATAAIPYAISGYGTKIMEWYLDGTLLDYVKVEDEIVDVSTTRTKYISLANLSQGIHSLQYRAYTMVDGEKFYSNVLYRDLIVVTGANNNPIIAVAATIPVSNEIIASGNLQLFGITQYVPYELKFAVYNPTSVVSTDAVIAVDGKVEATIATHNSEVTTYTLRPTEYGVKSLTITAGTTVYTLGLNISKSSTSLEPITDALQLDMMALGKSNNDVNKEEWVYGLYSATFSGFNWNKTSGWNNNRLLITNGAHVDVNIAPLSPDPTLTGKTLEFEFSTSNVSDDNAVICDLRNSSGTGLLITASEVTLISAGGAKVSTKFKSEENIRITFVINRKTGVANKGLVFIYVNGELSGAVNYATTDNFTSDKVLSIGNTHLADVQLKALRFYNSALNSDQVLNNYMLYRDTTEEMLSIYDKNNIYEDGTQNFSVDKLAAQCPVVIFTGDIPTLENTTDKNTTIYVDIEYINMQDPSKSFTGKGIRLRPQGTSSMGYPKKSFRIYTKYGTMWDYLGNVVVDGLYSFADRAQPVNVWCLKADYAESSGTHNTGVARIWNQVMYDAQVNGEYVLRTEAQKAAIAAGYDLDVRTTVDGFPCNVFYRLTPDSELIYIGKYNFNNDKSTESVFGFRDIPGFDNSKVECWEVLNNGNHLALFQDTNNFDTEWDKAFEARYPDGSKNTTALKSFCEWVSSTKGDIDKFKREKWDHLDVYKVAGKYVYLIRDAGVDQPVKNAMMTTEDGVHWFFINYDNDSILGLRNDGPLVYHYDIDRQTIDTSFSEVVYAFAGHDSTLWNNLEADEEFMQIVSEIDNALYMSGFSYDKVIDMFDNQQAGKWCERIYNQDAQYKYIGPFTDSGVNNLYMLQGSRKAHRRWWLSHRFDLYDSKFVSGAYKAKSIEFKAANAPAGIEFSITSGNNIYYGYGLNNVPIETGVRLAPGESHTFTSKQVINVGDPVRVYSAVNVQELDIHNFIAYLSTLNIAEVYNTSVGTKLNKLVMGVNTATDSRRNTSLSIISGLSQAKRLEYLDISGYKSITNIDLSEHIYLKALKAIGSGLTGLTLANGAPTTTLELPDTLQVLSLDNLPSLTESGFIVDNAGKNLQSIIIRNCSSLQSDNFIFNWYANKTSDSSMCSVVLEGVKWTNIDPVNLISLGGIKDAGGTLSIKGRIILTSCNAEQIEVLMSIYGDNCFNSGGELYITAPDAVYITGPTEIPEGNTAQFKATVFSEYPGTIRYYLLNGSSESISLLYASINSETGLLTTTEDGNHNITVRAKHTSSRGKVTYADMNVAIKAKIYPNSINIEGEDIVVGAGNIEYTLAIKPDNVTGDYTTVWKLDGAGVTGRYVVIRSQSNTSCVIGVLKESEEDIEFSVTAELTPHKGNKLTATKNIVLIYDPTIAITARKNPEAMAICYAQGWAASPDKMTKEEAAAVIDIGAAFNGSKMKSFDEFQWFTSLTVIPEDAFRNNPYLNSIIIPEGVLEIGGYAFYSMSALTSIKLPSTLKRIKDSYTFAYSSQISSLELPEGLLEIGNNAFCGCNSVTSLIIPESVEVMAGNAIYYMGGIESIYIKCPIINLGYNFLGNCRKIKMVRLGDKVSQINIVENGYQFSECQLFIEIIVDADNTHLTTQEGVLYDINKTKLIWAPSGLKVLPNIPETVASISNCAFYGGNISHVELPDTINSIGSYAFGYCERLESVTLPRISNIDEGVFFYCSILKSINIQDSLKEINRKAFRYCKALQLINLPNSIELLGDEVFEYCESLTAINIPPGVRSIGYSCFYGCASLDTIDLSSTKITKIANSCFWRCTKLSSVLLPDNLQIIGLSAFRNCENLSSIEIPLGVMEIGSAAFDSCLSLASITCHNPSAIEIRRSNIFGYDENNYTGRNTYDQGTNILYVPAGATGYDTGDWLDPLQNPEKCGFTISYTL